MRAGTKAPGQKSMPVDVDNTGKEIDGQVTFPALSTLYIEPKLYFMKSICHLSSCLWSSRCYLCNIRCAGINDVVKYQIQKLIVEN